MISLIQEFIELIHEFIRFTQERKSISASLELSKNNSCLIGFLFQFSRLSSLAMERIPRRTKRRLEDLEAEVSKLRRIAAEQESLVECSICKTLPRDDGPVPCCPRGHFVCAPCLRQWQESQANRNTCPTCRCPMGTGKSLLAATVIKHALHSCNNLDCTAKTPLAGIKEHEEVDCEFRRVLCPGNECEKLFPFNMAQIHVANCQHCVWPPRFMLHGATFCSSISFTRQSASNRHLDISWKTITIQHVDKGRMSLLLFKRFLKNRTYYFDIVMMGNKKESRKLWVSVSINDPQCGKPVYKASFHPR